MFVLFNNYLKDARAHGGFYGCFYALVFHCPAVTSCKPHCQTSVTDSEFVLFSLSVSGSQDIRNVIPFSGRGFLLGGKSQSSSSSVLAVEASLFSPISSPQKLFTPSSPAKSSGQDNKGISSTFTSIRQATSTGQKPPMKRSVSNTKVFVNINGSPVRISKPHSSSSSSSQEANKIKQRSIEELFSSMSSRKSLSQSSSSSTETERASLTSPTSTPAANSASSFFPKQNSDQSASSPRTSNPSSSQSKHSAVVSTGTKSSPATPTQSKSFNHSNSGSTSGAGGGGQAWRKRPRDDHSSSAAISYFFQKTLGSGSASSRESEKTKTPAVQQRTATAAASSSSSTSSLHSSAAPHSVTPSSSSSALMVSCPVCQAKVQESKINEHLDSCLS